eukprot:3592939-Amphidinium_carterae.1
MTTQSDTHHLFNTTAYSIILRHDFPSSFCLRRIGRLRFSGKFAHIQWQKKAVLERTLDVLLQEQHEFVQGVGSHNTPKSASFTIPITHTVCHHTVHTC